ncbi:MAG TPA: sulfotransferase domain-containing protein [Rhizomicrobium sp.]|jgi:aryl sulfotransferase|nr:sulfotransferase domain-containing protein [Rhizomicrobium sp.]
MPKLLRASAREVRTPATDSHRWDSFEPRDGDIIIGTYSKCGTTWMQRIVDVLVFQSPEIRPFGDISPWLDSTIFNPIEDDLATLAAQRHRRFIKSHLPFDALPLWDTVKYIHVGRDPRDACLSWHNHVLGTSPELRRRVIEQATQLAAAGKAPSQRLSPPPDDPRQFLLQWLDGLEAAPPDGSRVNEPTFFGFEATYWRERKRSNLLLVHYDDMQGNLAAEMRRVSDYLEIDTPEMLMPRLAEAASFDFMKNHGDALFPRLKLAFDRGADRFINLGRSGRWREHMEPGDVSRYATVSKKRASPGLLVWLERGRTGAGEPRAAPD